MSIPVKFDRTGTIEVNQERYDDLLHKEALLDSIKKLYDCTSDYVFRDALGHMLKTEQQKVSADE